MLDTDILRINAPTVIHESIDGEVVIVNLDTGGYFGLNPAATAVWRLIDGHRPVSEVLDRMRARYGACSRYSDEQVRRFLARLGENALVESGPSAAEQETQTPPETARGQSEDYEAPELLAYTDMQDLLLLDPIHDVGDGGWPKTKSRPPDEGG